ncbi:MAG: DUF1801 domain-containing protein [Bacteroidota bacterium]
MSKLKTAPNDQSVEAFLNTVQQDQKRRDAFELLALMEELTGEKPRMWGNSIVGFGSYHYKYDSGREGEWFLTGFSPRKTSFTLYVMSGLESVEEKLEKLGKHKQGKSCLYVNKLADIDLTVLEDMIKDSIAHLKHRYGA